MENQDKIQTVLEDFEKEPGKEIPTVLEEYLEVVAKTGKTVFQWPLLKTLFVLKLEQVMDEFNKDEPCERSVPFPNVENAMYDDMRKRILEAMHRFTSAPFTVQRLCELVTQPKKHYTQCDKFLRGIEKNVMVVSTVDPHGKKIVSESRVMMNGLDMNGSTPQNDDLDINDGQPFGSVPQVEWSTVGPTSVWPSPMDANNSNSSSSSDALEKDNETEATAMNDSDGASNDNSRTEVESKVDSDNDENKSDDDNQESAEKCDEENVNNSNSASIEDQNLVVSDCVQLPPSSSLFSRISEKVLSSETNEVKEVNAESGAISNSDIDTAVDSQTPEQPEVNSSDNVIEEDISSSEVCQESKEDTRANREEDKTMEEKIEDQEGERPELASKEETSSTCDDNLDEPPEKRMRLSLEDTSVSSSSQEEQPSQEQPSAETCSQQAEGEVESTTPAEQSESTPTTQENNGNSNEAEPSTVPDETPSDIGQSHSSSIQPDQSNDTLQTCDQTATDIEKEKDAAVEKSDSEVENSDNSEKCESTSDETDTQVVEGNKEEQVIVKEEDNEASSEASASNAEETPADTSQDEVDMETESATEEKGAENVPVVDESEPMDQE